MLGQVLRGTIAVGVLLVGLQVIGTILAVALDTDDVFFLVLGMAVALAVSGGAIFVIGLVATWTLAPLAAGWLGMAVGRHPYGYGADDRNLQRALGSLVLIAGLSVCGYLIWRHGYDRADPFRVVTGLLLAAGAWLVGLLGLVPRLYFAWRPGQAEERAASEGELPTLQDQADNLVIGLVVCVMAGMGLARCTAASVGHRVDGAGRIVLPLGDWVFACVDSDRARPDCHAPARFAIRPDRGRGRRIRLTATRACPELHIRDAAGHPVESLGDQERDALGIPRRRQQGMANDHVVFDCPAGQHVTIEVGAGAAKRCRAGLRYAIEPTSRFGQRAR